MALDIQKFSLAAGAMAGILFTVCSAFFALWPVLGMRLAGPMIHLLNVDKYAGDIGVTWAGFLLGLVQWIVYTYLGALLFAWLYNRFLKNSPTA